LLDAAKHGCESIEFVAALQLPFVPPGCADVGQWPDHVICLGRVTWGEAAEDDLKGTVVAVLLDVRDQVTDLVDRRNVAVPGRRVTSWAW
jgi:hypothetical protein